MKVRILNRLTKGQKVTKIKVWDEGSQFFTDGEEVKAITYVYVPDLGRYCDGGDKAEDEWTLSEILRKDMILEIWTEAGKIWQAQFNTVEDIIGKDDRP